MDDDREAGVVCRGTSVRCSAHSGDYEGASEAVDASGQARTCGRAYRVFASLTAKWRVDSFAGCKTKKLQPAIPAPGSTNDVFMIDECPRGQVVRALTAEGQENWRTWISEKEVDLSNLGSYEPKALLSKSVCDSVK